MKTNDIILKLKNIEKTYSGIIDTKVLKGINFEIKKGEFVSIIGQSGSGKTTLLNLIGLIDKPTFGEIIFNNEIVNFDDISHLANLRNLYIGFVFQFHFLLEEFTILENILIPTWIKSKKNNSEYKKRALELLEFVGLIEHINKKPSQLSGGQQQRVAIARSLINNPSIVFADEPTGNLDSENTKKIYSLLREINLKYNTTFIVVTHDSNIANLCDRKIELVDGQII